MRSVSLLHSQGCRRTEAGKKDRGVAVAQTPGRKREGRSFRSPRRMHFRQGRGGRSLAWRSGWALVCMQQRGRAGPDWVTESAEVPEVWSLEWRAGRPLERNGATGVAANESARPRQPSGVRRWRTGRRCLAGVQLQHSGDTMRAASPFPFPVRTRPASWV